MTRQRITSNRDEVMKAAAERDGGWFCRYCGCVLAPLRDQPLVTQQVMRARSTVGGGCGCGGGTVLPDGTRECIAGCVYSTDRTITCVDRFSNQPGALPNREHLIPVSRGGDDSLDNTGLSCGPCNFQKGRMTEAEYRAWLAARVPT